MLFVLFVLFVSWGSNLSPAPSAWLAWLLPARLGFVTPVSLRGSALVFSPTPEPGYFGFAELRERNPLAFAFGFGSLPFPCRGSAKVLVPSPGKDLSGKRLSGKRRDADVAGPELQPARSRLRLGSLQLPCRVCFGLTSKASPEIKTLTGISVGKLSSPGKDPWVSWWSLFPGDGKRRFAFGSLCLPRCCRGFNPKMVTESIPVSSPANKILQERVSPKNGVSP